MTDTTRANNFDALRLLLAVLVIVSHCFPLGTGSEIHEPLMVATRGQLTLGGLAVDWFFVISGYLITQSWERSSGLSSFMRKRFVRIYPGFIVATAVCSWIIAPLGGVAGWHAYSLSYAFEFLRKVPFLRFPEPAGVFAANPFPFAINGSLWSIPYEFWCYIGVASLGLLKLISKRALIASLFVVTVVIHLVFEVFQLRPGGGIGGAVFGYPPLWARLLPLYLAGVVYYQYREALRPNGKFTLLACVGLAIAARIPHGLAIALPVFGTYVLFYLALSKTIRLHGVAKHGDFSYGVYLYAFPIQQLLVHWVGHAMSPLLLFSYALPAVLVAAALSWFLVERPCLRAAAKRRGLASAGVAVAGVGSSAASPR